MLKTILRYLIPAALKPEPVKPEQWAHGFKTPRVVATRMTGEHIGFVISFAFPLHPHKCDSSRLIDYIRTLGGVVFSCGGSPGAPVVARFASMPDIASANVALPTILTQLDDFVATL